MTHTITSVVDSGGDVLTVTATDEAGNEVQAFGWVSATTNHFDEPRTDSSKPRTMTPAEVGEYAQSLLDGQLAASTAPQEPTPIAFVVA